MSTKKIKNAHDLKELRDKMQPEIALRLEGAHHHHGPEGVSKQVLVCVGGGCLASGSLAISAALREEIAAHGLAKKVEVVETGCMGPCAVGPVIKVMPDGVFYENLKPNDIKEIVQQHLLKHEIVTRLIHKDIATGKSAAKLAEIEYFQKQKKVVLRNCGIIDPLLIEEYIAMEGYAGLAKALASMKAEEVVESVTQSGLRGRGGGGFPTGLKWQLTRRAKGDQKNVVCNADEGDPGAFMDRSVLEGDPHSVIECMAIAGYAIGASRGYVYCRAEYPIAVERLNRALDQARQYGLLGKKILGSDFDFDIEIRMGSGAFVCGEETALMTSIEGKRGEPRDRKSVV